MASSSAVPSSQTSTPASILEPLENAYRAAPDATYCVFAGDDFILSNDLPDLGKTAWKPHDMGSANTLLDLFDTPSHEDVIDGYTRLKMVQFASTTVRTLAGHPIRLSLHALDTEYSQTLAILDSSTTQLGPDRSGAMLRTRVICAPSGEILATEGPAGSYAHADFELGQWSERLVAQQHRDKFHETIARVLAGEPYASTEVHGAAPSLSFDITVVRHDGNLLVDFFDTSDRIAAIEALERSQTQFNQLSATLPVGVFVVEAGGRVKFVSERLREMFGPHIATEFGWQECIHPDDQAIASQAFAELPNNRHFNIEIRAEMADGDYKWSRWVGSDVRDDEGQIEYVVGFVEDISEWRELNSQIAYQASFDGLTDLPNRMTLIDELRKRLQAQDTSSMTGVLFIDLDEFKLINDTQGHSVGDIVLLEVAQRFRRALRPSDLIGRFGGDEFVVVASDISGPEEAEAISRRLHDILSTPVLADGRIITVNASIGIALSSASASSSEQLIGDADIAMYEAKASGRNRSVLFDATLRARASQRFDMTADLRHARRRRELRLEYQPILGLNDNEIVGVEALVRWEHPGMGRISPAVFIPLAEEIGLIDDVGEWVVEQACADLDRLRGHGLVSNDFTISINASAQQFRNVAALATSSLASLDQFGLQPRNLRFELTESVPLTQIPEAASRIRQLTNYGFGLAIDDFGTGYSSLGYLTMLPFDVLKLDLSLIAQLAPGAAALAVVECLTQMSHEMGFKIVAEGIETDSQRSLLRNVGVQLGQGYHLGRPVPLSGIIDVLEAGPMALPT